MLNQRECHALVLARTSIEEKTGLYVCLALGRLAGENKILESTHLSLLRRIDEMLGGCSSLDGWLIKNDHATHDELFPRDEQEYEVAEARRRLTRVHWINWMLEEL